MTPSETTKFLKQKIKGIIINFWSKYKQRLLKNMVKNNKYLFFLEYNNKFQLIKLHKE